MAVGFGGSPLLSLLTGAAKGVSDAQKREEEKKRQAFLDSLRQASAQRADAQLDLQLRQQRQREADARRERHDEASAERLEGARSRARDREFESFRETRLPELIDGGMSMGAAGVQLRREFEKGVEPFQPEPEEQESERDRLLNIRTGQQIEESERDLGLDRARDTIMADQAARAVLSDVENPNDAEAFFDAHQGAGNLEGVSKAQFMQVLEQEREDTGPAPRQPSAHISESVGTAAAKKTLMGATTEEEVRSRARDALASLDRLLDDPVAVSQSNEANVRAAQRHRQLLKDAMDLKDEALRELGLNLVSSGGP